MGRLRRTAPTWCALLTGVTSVLTGVGAPTASAAPAAPVHHRPAPADLSRSALESSVRTTDTVTIDAAVKAGRSAATAAAASTPTAAGSAAVVFAEGRTTAEVAALVGTGRLDLLTAEAKVPVGDSDEVYTLWFNDFERTDGSIAEKLDRAVGKMRLRYFREASATAGGRKSTLTELAQADVRFYKVEVVGSHAAFGTLAADRTVAAVLPDKDTAKVTRLAAQRAALAKTGQRATAVAGAAPIEIPAAAVPKRGQKATPVRTTAGRSCTWQDPQATVVCGTSSAAKGSATAGTTRAAPGATTLAADYAAMTSCNSPANTESCPNDNVYRPHPNTGGYQDFGVAIANYAAGYNVFYDCYVVWVPDGPDYPSDPDIPGGGGHAGGGYYAIQCYPYSVYTPAFTWGTAQWDSLWGTQTMVDPYGQQVVVSTAGYKHPELGQCPPVINTFTGECDKRFQNVVQVPRNGFEDEVLIPNPGCTTIRGGTSQDWNYGCFWPTQAASNLPSPVLDTTFSDTAAIYDLAVLSVAEGGIQEGRLYTSVADFFAYGNNNVLGMTAHHAVAIDTNAFDSLVCRLYGTDPFCFFPLDSSRVSEKVPFTSA